MINDKQKTKLTAYALGEGDRAHLAFALRTLDYRLCMEEL